MKAYSTNVFITDYYLEARHQKLYGILGERLYWFLDLFRQADHGLTIGVFDDSDRIYLDMVLADQGLTIDTLDDFHHYKGSGKDEATRSLLKQIDGTSFVEGKVIRDEQAKEFCKQTREMVYRIFGTHIVSPADYKLPVAVLCKEYNVDFVTRCINHFHGPKAEVENFENTPFGYHWVLSGGV